ncbi:MAG: HD domain-containing protein [Chloroflexi bacterium]|nr:HD domain-containing protein [Chloroflexota bacterium]
MNPSTIDFDAMQAFVRDCLVRTEPKMASGHNSWRNTGLARWEHTQRVLTVAQRIARAENADYDLVTVAAIFHDVAKFESTPDEHAARGAEIAAEYLARAGFSMAWTKRVGEIICNHVVSSAENFKLEDCILRDADVLDEVGALSIVWTLLNTGIQAPSYAEARERILKHDRHSAERAVALMLTQTGRAISKERLAFVNRFIAQLDEELGL